MLNEPVDPDVDLRIPDRHKDLRPRQGPVVAVVALGGAVGAVARYGASLLWPTAADAFPWTTLTVNAIGCAVIGVFMVVIIDVWAAHRLVRPFFGTGVLGGFTTFSTYATDIQRLVDRDEARTGLAYLALTLLAAMASVWIAVTVTRRIIEWRQP
ncbi:fluoride efflux transporter CrcB [Streptomyces sp. NPDC056930]|uniref:fluoride efflux transporter CrcB n=1 Tax=unclassified Streptomyces TaxID=2593676 RepID=UPI00363809B8